MAETSSAARLFVLAGPDIARSFPLAERTTLGRSDECDVVLRDRSISRKHAVLVRQGERWFVQDLGSTNGVSKDGQRAERIELADGDEFRLGELPLRIKLGAEPAAQDIEFDLAPASVPPAAPAAPKSKAPAPAEGGVELEEVELEEVEIEDPSAAGTQATSVPKAARASPLAATAYAPRSARRSGFFSADVAQQPFWLRTVLVLALILLGAGLAYGSYLAVQMLRTGL